MAYITLSPSVAINALLFGTRWAGGAPDVTTALTYSFPGTSSLWDYVNAYGDPGEPNQGLLQLSDPLQQGAVTSALGRWAAVAGLLFTQVTDDASGNGQLRFAFTDWQMGPLQLGYTFLPNDTANGGDVWLNAGLQADVFAAPTPGSLAFFTLVHEIGHALGLKHPDVGSGASTATLGAPDDTIFSTVMSSNAWVGLPLTFAGNIDRFPSTPMSLDIDAMQFLYGANTAFAASDDIYTFSASGKYLQTIYDTGGNDTIVLTGGTGGEIDLRPGEWSRLGLPVQINSGAIVQPDTVQIYSATLIENAVGGDGNDSLIGNTLANQLTGNGGDDTLDGGEGADSLAGGNGNDIYIVDTGDSVVESPGEGSWDFINAYASRTLEANVEAMIMLNGANGTGNAQDNALYGNYDGAANTLTGGDGNDIYSVGAGDVVVENPGEGSWDFINAYVSRTLEANVEAMIMLGGSDGTGNAQENALYGNYDAAANILTGLAGNDVYILGADDFVVEAADGGVWDFLVTYATHTLEANVEAMILDNGANGFGNSQDNALYGNFDAAANTMAGGAGNDVYNVGAGDVVLENPGEGSWDFIFAFAAHTLEANVEALIMLNGATGTGNAQANTLYGNWDAAANLLIGGGGDDTYVVSAGDTVQEGANQGTDAVVAFASFVLPTDVDNLSLSGTDPINGTGNSVANLILGNGADNTIAGKGGNDRLFGGAGVDRFVFDSTPNAATNVDVITDFTPGTDKVVLDQVMFAQLAGGVAAGNLVAAPGVYASEADDTLLYDTSGGNLFYDADGSGAGVPVWFAHLDNSPALSVADFSVI